MPNAIRMVIDSSLKLLIDQVLMTINWLSFLIFLSYMDGLKTIPHLFFRYQMSFTIFEFAEWP